MKNSNKLGYDSTKHVQWNNNDLASIKKAEKRKRMLENKGYILKDQFINHISGDCTLTYFVQTF